MLACQLTLFAQQVPNPLMAAKKKLDINHPSYNPVQAFAEFTALAGRGNAIAMNALGMLYMQGLGVAQDDQQAISWFEKAALAGYPKAWYNWGTMYKNGDGTAQDFAKALEIFKRGAEKGSSNSMYAAGFMLYKGLGCQQDYTTAVKLFKQGAVKKSLGAMYMMGLCYRNGYGTAVNTDSARYWLSKSYTGGYQQAKTELLSTDAENLETAIPVASIGNKSRKQSSVQSAASIGKAKQTFVRVRQQIPQENISGTYKGYIIRYDWSGQHIISKSELKLNLNHTKGMLSGKWTEADTLDIPIQAMFTDSSLVFNATQYQRTDHYSPNNPLLYQFKDAHLQLIKSANSVFIAGDLTLWSISKREPEPPVYISLVRQQQNTTLEALPTNTHTLQEANLVVYPNPFESTITVNFFSHETVSANIQLADMNGKVLYHKKLQLQQGQQSHVINTSVVPGAYILKLSWPGFEKTTVVIKK